MSVFLCQRLNMLSCPAFFVQCSAADMCCTFLFAFSAQSLNSGAVLSVTPAAVMTMVSFCFVCYKCCSDDHGSYCLPSIMCAGDGAGGRTKPVKSVVYTNTPKLVPGASSPAAILPTKSSSVEDVRLTQSTFAEDTKLTKSTFAEDTKLIMSTSVEDTTPATPASKAAAKPAKAAHGFRTRLVDKAAVEPTTVVAIEASGRTAGQSPAEVGIRSPEQPGEYIPAVRTASKSAGSSAKQSATSEAAGKQPLASNTEVRVNYLLHPVQQVMCSTHVTASQGDDTHRIIFSRPSVSNQMLYCIVPLPCCQHIDWICNEAEQCMCARLSAMHFWQTCVMAPLQSHDSV